LAGDLISFSYTDPATVDRIGSFRSLVRDRICNGETESARGGLF